MRLFIAIQLSDEMKKSLVACMHDLKKQGVEGNYVPTQNLHLTSKKAYQVHLPKAEMTVKKVSLMKSEVKNGKAAYREVLNDRYNTCQTCL